ncbi:MAG TPA: GNAT family protein [Myxococcota bacterium]|nr:GNAT family protein [Myxococcota bacterium]
MSETMSVRTNHLGQPIGAPLSGWTPRARPPRTSMQGRLCRLDPVDADRHARALHEAYAADVEGRNWTYLPYGPFESADAYTLAIKSVQGLDDPMPFAIVDLASERPVGVASYLNIVPPMGSIEVGAILYSPALQRSPAATEAMYLMMRRVFDELGYRRYEWKCDSLNAASRRAALRLGFRFEGIFRQAWVVKARNRDTAWYSVIDSEWPALRTAFERWLDPSNFDAQGRQRARLEDLRD